MLSTSLTVIEQNGLTIPAGAKKFKKTMKKKKPKKSMKKPKSRGKTRRNMSRRRRR